MTTTIETTCIERPILFSTDMIKAIRDGRKTQTRRLAGLEVVNADPDNWNLEGVYHDTPDTHVFAWFKNKAGSQLISVKCPYGKPGDELWVRETWGYYRHIGGDDTSQVLYKADMDACGQYPAQLAGGPVMVNMRGPWKPSIHMPRKHSRIQLRITDIRVERLKGISPGDAANEGVEYWNIDPDSYANGELVADYKNYAWKDDENDSEFPFPTLPNPAASFRTLWQSINGPESWDVNPWVWVVEFELIEKGGEPA